MRYKEIVHGPGKWRRLQVRDSGECTFITETGPVTGTYELGLVTTGRSRVYAGVFVQVTTPTGETYGADDRHSYVGALRELNKALFILGGCILDAAGVDLKFYQTGLTAGTEWGYHPLSAGPVNMFDLTPGGHFPTAGAGDDHDHLDDGVPKPR